MGGREKFSGSRGSLLALMAAFSTACTGASNAQASSPSLTWQGAERVSVFCQVTSYDYDVQAFETALCARIGRLAGQGAPAPVSTVGAGDSSMVQPGTVTLLVQGAVLPARSITPRAQGRVMAFTIRPFRVGVDDSVLFGTAPQAVQLSPSMTVESRALDAALDAALSETLPWRVSQSSRSRLLPQPR